MRDQFSGDFKMTFHLTPPMLPGSDPTGRPKKREFGPWALGLFKVLAGLKGLRGTPLDLFGYTAERRAERRLIEDYRALISRIAVRPHPTNLAAGIELVRAASEIRGYGPVREASIEAYELRMKTLLGAFEAASTQPQTRAA